MGRCRRPGSVSLPRRGCGPAARAVPGSVRHSIACRRPARNAGEALDELLDGDLQLETGQVRPEATVDAEPERRVAVLLTVDHERVGIVELLRIAVGRRERQQHPVVLLHRTAVEVVVLGHQARHRHRGVGAEELLERERHHVGVVEQALVVLGVLGEVPQRRSDGRPRRVDPGDEQQHDHAADHVVVHRLPVDLHVQEVAGEIVTGVLAMIGDLGVDVGAELVHPLAGARFLGDPFDHVVHELAEQLLVLGGEPEHATDDADRDVLGVLHGRVDDGLARGDLAHVVEQLPAQLLDLGLPRLDLLGRERRQQETAGHVVERGSLVIGGAPPIGAGIARSPGRPTDTITERLVKCSVSYAISLTVSCVTGTHIPP
jgi:hypothetical protein